MQTKTTAAKTTAAKTTAAKVETAPKATAAKAPKTEPAAKPETAKAPKVAAGHGVSLSPVMAIKATAKVDASRPGSFRAALVQAIRSAATVGAAVAVDLGTVDAAFAGRRPSGRDVAFCAGMGYISVVGVELSRADVVPAAKPAAVAVEVPAAPAKVETAKPAAKAKK